MSLREAPSLEEQAAALGERITGLRTRIAELASDAGRDPTSVHLHAATKGVGPLRVLLALRNGLTHLGENWVQEAAPKIDAANRLAEEHGVPSPTWHMIGHLQRNKVSQALGVFQAIDTVDSLRLAETISRRAERLAMSPINALIEVDFTDDPERGGFKIGLGADDQRLAGFMEDARRIIELPNLNIVGLMTVGPMSADAEESRPGFRRLRELRDAVNDSVPSALVTELSMGMTNDFHVAIQEGATVIRLGTAIFGPRPAGRTY